MLLALPIGMLIGLTLGALGGGGSILTVPALVYLLGQSAHGATTASLIIVGITSLAGMAVHLRAGRVQVRSGIVFGILGAGGAFAGSRLSANIDPNVLLVAFSVLLAAAAVTMLRRKRPGAAPAPEPSAPGDSSGHHDRDDRSDCGVGGSVAVRHSPPRADPRAQTAPSVSPVRVVIAATAVGLVTGFFGVGGGFVVVPALVLALGFDMPTAVGTSLLVIAINSASALLSRLGTHVSIGYALVIAFTVAAVAGAIAGSRIASKVRPERLAVAFAVLMVLIALYTAARSISALA
ncbi:MAG: sulfite exporter TauE/SafE family protein [Streptosporangiaceae bacterium]